MCCGVCDVIGRSGKPHGTERGRGDAIEFNGSERSRGGARQSTEFTAEAAPVNPIDFEWRQILQSRRI
jgi:hypothetical protein